MASISRFGRAISSGKSASDKSFPSRSAVSAAVWSSRFAKSESAVPVVIKNSSRSSWPRTIGYGAGFVNSGRRVRGALKPLEKAGIIRGYHSMPAVFRPRPPPLTRSAKFARCPYFVADFVGRAGAAISAGAAVSRRTPGLDADGLALADGRAGVAAMDRFQRDFAVAAALGGGIRRREFLQPSRHRLGRAAQRDRRRGGWRDHAWRLDHHPAGGEKPVPVAGAQRGPQGPGISARAVDRSGAAEAADPGNLSQHRRTRPKRTVRRASRLYLRLRPSGISPRAARSGAAGGDPSQSGQAQRPQSRPRRAPSGRHLYGPGAGFGLAAMLERKSCFLSQIWAILPVNHPSFAGAHPL